MAYTTVDDPTQNFNTIVWTGAGDSSARSFTGVGFQPDWVWYMSRSETYNNNFVDSVRGVGADKELVANTSGPEGNGDSSTHGYLSSFDTDGFSSTNGSSNNLEFNQNSETFVAWNWKVGTSFSNDASATSVGTIDSSGKVDTPGAVSIVSWTGTGSAGTIKHGLSTTPKMIWVKRRDADDTWWTYNETIGNGAYLALNSNAAKNTSGASGLWNSTSPTSSVFSVGTNTGVNGSGGTYIAYCFADVKGYSKIGSYTGNGNADGQFIYTGFLPAWSIVKPVDVTQNWQIHDLKRLGYNVKNYNLSSNSTAAEAENDFMDIVSNGFKIRRADVLNVSGDTYIYMAFAESPFTNSNGVPNNAR